MRSAILTQVTEGVDMVVRQNIRLREARDIGVHSIYCIVEMVGLSRSCYIGVDNLAAVEVLGDSDTAWSGPATKYP